MTTCPFKKAKCVPGACALGTTVNVDGEDHKTCVFTLMTHNITVIAKNTEPKEE